MAKAREEGLVGRPRRPVADPTFFGVHYRHVTGIELPCEATGLLMRSLPVGPGETFLDMGSGSGVVGIYAAQRGADVTAVDISAAAVSETLGNAERNRVTIRALQGDLFARTAGRFDRIAFNAPFVRLTRGGLEDKRCRDRTGVSRLRTVTNFLRELPRHLEDGGMGYLVLSSASPVALFERTAREAGLEWDVLRTWTSTQERVQLVGLRAAEPDRLGHSPIAATSP